MEPLQPMVRQGVAQLKDFITKLVDIQEKDGERFRARPRPLPRPPQASPSTHSPMLKFAPPPAPPLLPLRLGLTCCLTSLARRAGPAASPELAGTPGEGRATLHPQDQEQRPPHVLLLQEAPLLPHHGDPQLCQDPQLQGG